MDQAFLLIKRAPQTDPPTDEELAATKLTRDQAYELLAKLGPLNETPDEIFPRTRVALTAEPSLSSHLDGKRATRRSDPQSRPDPGNDAPLPASPRVYPEHEATAGQIPETSSVPDLEFSHSAPTRQTSQVDS